MAQNCLRHRGTSIERNCAVRIANVNNRLVINRADGVVDVETASKGQFSSSVQAVYERWDDFREWAAGYTGGPTSPLPSPELIGPPVPRPNQIFAIGANYDSHAAEANLEIPPRPMVFTKFPSSVTGPYATVELPSGEVDFEVELVVVIGREARRVEESEAWDHVAGLTVGQDLSERVLQVAPPLPQQFSLAKSFEGFAPIGPALVTPDEFDDRNDIAISCEIDGQTLQKDRTANLLFTVPFLVSYLSQILPLRPGDLIFTGTPAGIGWARSPQRFIKDGEVLVTRASGIGEMRNTFESRTVDE